MDEIERQLAEFEEAMAREGVRPAHRSGKAAPRPRPKSPSAPAPAPRPPAAPSPEPSPEAQLREAAEKARDEAHAETAALRERVERADKELTDARRQVAQLQSERDRARATAPSEPLPASAVTDLLARRGLREDEGALALSGLASQLLPLLTTAHPEALCARLAEAVSLVCGAPGCPPQPGAVVIPVERERCDVCGGSDIARAARALADACRTAAVHRLRVVGGSPNYRTQLRELLTEAAPQLKLKLIDGQARRTRRDAAADLKHSDLLVIWGGTIIDHATSELYMHKPGEVVVVAHRGIVGMLNAVTTHLSRGMVSDPDT